MASIVSGRSSAPQTTQAPLRSSAVSKSRHSDLIDLEVGQTLLVNAAFLQEIKDSNPPLWHAAAEMRALCELELPDLESPQVTIKKFVVELDSLRDLLALQFALEESYGYLKVSASMIYDDQSFMEQADKMGVGLQTKRAVEQHRRLYLDLVELVESAEELQYRGCQTDCLRSFADRVGGFLRDLTAHERLEADLISSKRG